MSLRVERETQEGRKDYELASLLPFLFARAFSAASAASTGPFSAASAPVDDTLGTVLIDDLCNCEGLTCEGLPCEGLACEELT